MLIGVISDTHGLVRPEALAALVGSELILHAGDVGDPTVLVRLAEIAPVRAVRGNNDRGAWADDIPLVDTIEAGGARIYLLHDAHELDLDARAAGVQAVVAGHSHRPRLEVVDGVLHFNPGSAGPRRFKLPISVGKLRVTRGTIKAEIVEI
jgi:putative phosphoesterase